MTRAAKGGLILLGLAGASVGCYFIFRKSKETLKAEILGFDNSSSERKEEIKTTLDKMTRRELVAVNKMFYGMTYKIPPTDELKKEISAISYKYNIFT